MRNMLLRGRQYKCAASTRMHQALTDTRSTNGVDHFLFDQRTQARRQQVGHSPSLAHSLTHSLTHSHSLAHSLTHSLTHSPVYKLTLQPCLTPTLMLAAPLTSLHETATLVQSHKAALFRQARSRHEAKKFPAGGGFRKKSV